MKKAVAMKDIAQKLGVSIVTVSKALSNKEGVSAALRGRIIETAASMGYQYPQLQKAKPRGYTVGVLVAHRFLGPSNGFYWDIYQNIMQRLAKRQDCTILEEVMQEQEDTCTPPNLLIGRQIDGLILLGQLHTDYIKSVQQLGIPMLLLDFYDRRVQADSVQTDNVYGSYFITNYLIENGHRKIGFVGSIHSTSSILDRYVGYYKALLESELPIREEWVIPDRDQNGGIFSDFVLPEEMPTAFVCNCDETAYRFVQVLNAHGFRVPEDVSIVSFDNYLFSAIANPPITTMAVDIARMTDTVAECIRQKIETPGLKVGRRLIECQIIPRESVKKHIE